MEQEDKETLCDLEEEAVSIAQSPRRHSTFYESGHFKFPKSYPEAVFVLHERSSDSEKECENLAAAASAEPRVSFESGSATPTPDESPDVYDAFFSDLKQTYARLVDEYDAKRKEIDSGKSSASDSNKNCFVSSKTITDARKAKFIDAIAHELANRTDEVGNPLIVQFVTYWNMFLMNPDVMNIVCLHDPFKRLFLPVFL